MHQLLSFSIRTFTFNTLSSTHCFVKDSALPFKLFLFIQTLFSFSFKLPKIFTAPFCSSLSTIYTLQHWNLRGSLYLQYLYDILLSNNTFQHSKQAITYRNFFTHFSDCRSVHILVLTQQKYLQLQAKKGSSCKCLHKRV